MMVPIMLAFSGLQSTHLPASRVGIQMSAFPKDVAFDMPGDPDAFPPKKVNVAEYVAGKNVILVGLPGAFTPT
jgi:peroxiredoxin